MHLRGTPPFNLMHGPRSGRVSIGFPEPRPNARNRRVYRLSRRLSVYGGHKSRRVRLRRREAITRRLLRVGGGLRAAARERDPQGRQRVFRDRARPRPDEVSAFIDAYRARFGVEPICRVLDVSASAYYHRATGARSARAAGDERLLALIEQVHVDNYDAYGYRKTWLALKRRGVRVGRVASSASCARRDSGGQAARQAMADHDPGPGRAPAPDLVDRDFTADRPDELWVADFTYLRCWEGLVFFSFVLDAFSRRVVGWQFSTSMRTDLVLDALRMALTRRAAGADVELTHHSDAGTQYTQFRVSAGARRSRRPELGRVGRRRARQRDGRELRRHLQDRTDRRPRLADPSPARARHRRMGRLVQHHPATPVPRRHPARRAGSSLRSTERSKSLPLNEKREPPNPVSAKPSPPHAVCHPAWSVLTALPPKLSARYERSGRPPRIRPRWGARTARARPAVSGFSGRVCGDSEPQPGRGLARQSDPEAPRPDPPTMWRLLRATRTGWAVRGFQGRSLHVV
jgi:transposase InsO family protein